MSMMKIVSSSKEIDFQEKEVGSTGNIGKFFEAPSSSREWSRFKNPRIVRVPRSFGGKDRHSKVSTIKGIRDRRIRLSVPTAIQLYGLQERLGLGQPSKVIDWLLDATKHEIDKLPPLQMPPGNFSQFHQPALHVSNAPQSFLSSFFNPKMARSEDWDSDATLRAKSKEVKDETTFEKSKWIKTNELVLAQNTFPIANYSSSPILLNNPMPYNSCYHWHPSNFSLSQTDDPRTSYSIPQPSAFALPSGPQQLFSLSAATSPAFAPYGPYSRTTLESEARQINQFHFLSSSSQHILQDPLMSSLDHSISMPMNKPSPLNVNSRLHLHSQNNNKSQGNKGTIDS